MPLSRTQRALLDSRIWDEASVDALAKSCGIRMAPNKMHPNGLTSVDYRRIAESLVEGADLFEQISSDVDRRRMHLIYGDD